MGDFIRNDNKYNKIISKYKKMFETSKISMPYEDDGRLYRQIVFNKIFSKNTCGFVIVTNEGIEVHDKSNISKLVKPFYYMETLVNSGYKSKLRKTILSNRQKQKELQNNKKIIFALDALKRDNVVGIDIVKDIFSQIPDNKVENNKCVLDFIHKVDEYDKKDTIFNSKIIEDILLYHRKTLIKNHERVKLINKGRDYYDGIKREVSGKNRIKRRAKGRDFTICAYSLDYSMDYFRNMLNLYDKIVDMSESQYDKYLQNIENKRLEERLTLSRG